MNKKIKRHYLEMQGKIILPEEAGCNNSSYAATVAANFVSIGYPMTSEMITKLSHATEKDIKEFYDDYTEIFKEMLGSVKNPFYPNFPEQCMELDDADYFIDQILYAFSGLTLEPRVYTEQKKRFPFIGTPMRRVLMEGSLEDLEETFCLAVNSQIAYSKKQREFIMDYVKAFPEAIQAILDNADTKNRENAVACAVMTEKVYKNNHFTKMFIKQPADLLRYAAFKATEKENPEKDAFAAISLRGEIPMFRLGRKERTFIMETLSNMGSEKQLVLKMNSHQEEWKMLFSKLHITDKAWDKKRFCEVKKAIAFIQSGEKLDRPARRIEEAIKAGDVRTAVNEAKKMPGDFMRRFDKLYRMSIEQGNSDIVMDAMKEVCAKAGIATITGTIGNIEKRTEEEEVRYFKNTKNKIYTTNKKNRAPLTDAQAEAAIKVAKSGMAQKFKGKDPMGNVYIGGLVKDVKIPADIRSNSGGIGINTSGSKMPIPEDWKIMRFFVGWTNLDDKDRYSHRVDIDLSATICSDLTADAKVVHCGWNGYKNDKGYLYSGDVQDGGPASGEGRAEFIDLDLEKLRDEGYRYVIPSVNSYTEQKFSEQPNTCFGVMKRTSKDMGKAYQPETVVNKFVLDADCIMFNPYIIDIQNMEIVWMNELGDSNVASMNFYDMFNRANRSNSSKTMSLLPLIEANVEANGTMSSPEDADIVFVANEDELETLRKDHVLKEDVKIILSNNMEYIAGFLMAEVTDNPDKGV